MWSELASVTDQLDRSNKPLILGGPATRCAINACAIMADPPRVIGDSVSTIVVYPWSIRPRAPLNTMIGISPREIDLGDSKVNRTDRSRDVVESVRPLAWSSTNLPPSPPHPPRRVDFSNPQSAWPLPAPASRNNKRGKPMKKGAKNSTSKPFVDLTRCDSSLSAAETLAALMDLGDVNMSQQNGPSQVPQDEIKHPMLTEAKQPARPVEEELKVDNRLVSKTHPIRHRLLCGQNIRLHALTWTEIEYEWVECERGVPVNRENKTVEVPRESCDAMRSWATTYSKAKDFGAEARVQAQWLINQYDFDFASRPAHEMVLALSHLAAVTRSEIQWSDAAQAAVDLECERRTMLDRAKLNMLTEEDVAKFKAAEAESRKRWWISLHWKVVNYIRNINPFELVWCVLMFYPILAVTLTISFAYPQFFTHDCNFLEKIYWSARLSMDLSKRSFRTFWDWVKDLTRYGIEPDPGPFTVVVVVTTLILLYAHWKFASLPHSWECLYKPYLTNGGDPCGWMDMSYAELSSPVLRQRRIFWDWVKDLTTEGIEPDPGPIHWRRLAWVVVAFFLFVAYRLYLVSLVPHSWECVFEPVYNGAWGKHPDPCGWLKLPVTDVLAPGFVSPHLRNVTRVDDGAFKPWFTIVEAGSATTQSSKLISYFDPWLNLTVYGIEPNPGPIPMAVRTPISVLNAPYREAGLTLCKIASNKLAPMREGCTIRLPKQGLVREIKTSAMANTTELVPGFSPMHFSKCSFNEYSSIRNRVTCELPPHDSAFVDKFVRWVKKHVKKFFKGCRVEKNEIMSFEEYLERSNATPSAKRAYVEARDQLEGLGLDEHTRLSSKQVSDFTIRKTFMKCENLLYLTPYGMKDKSPRNISGAQPEFIALTGPFFKTLQDKVKAKWNSSFCLTMSSGMTGVEMGMWVKKLRELLFGEDDVGKYDVSIHRALLELEYWIYCYLGAPVAVRQLVEANIETRAKTSGGIYYETPDGRKSGDPYTSLGNTILNGLMHLFIYCHYHRLTVKQGMSELSQLLQGDDNVLAYKRWTPFDKLMNRLGFDSEFIQRKSPFEISFCSSYLLPFEGCWSFVPHPYRVALKFGVFVNQSPMLYADLRATSAKGLYNLLSWHPSIREMLDEAILGGKQLKQNRFEWELWNSRPLEATSETWVHVNRKWGPIPTGQAGWHRVAEMATDGPTVHYSKTDFLPSSVWIRDLTQEGVEPHPGPNPVEQVPQPRCSTLGAGFRRSYDADPIQLRVQFRAARLAILAYALDNFGHGLDSLSIITHPSSNQIQHSDQTNATGGNRNPRNAACPFHENELEIAPRLACSACAVAGRLDSCPLGDHQILLRRPRIDSSRGGVEMINIDQLVLEQEYDYDSPYDSEPSTPSPPPQDPPPTDLTTEGIEPNPGPPRKGAKHPKRKVVKKKNKPVVVRGRGAYSTSSSLGARAGKLGDAASAIWDVVTGRGSYEVKSNSILEQGPPVFRRGLEGTIRVGRRCYLGDVVGSVGFTTPWLVALNPGLPGLDPELQAIAKNFEEYEIKGMIFEFKSTSANALNSTNTALGTVIMAAQYDPLDPLFANKFAMENYQYARSCKPSEDCIYPLECARSRTPIEHLYVRNGAVPNGADLRLYDFATFTLACVGMQATAVIGELWVSYDIALYKPKIPPVLNYFTNHVKSVMNASGAGTTDAGAGTGGTTTSIDGLQVLRTPAANQIRLVFPILPAGSVIAISTGLVAATSYTTQNVTTNNLTLFSTAAGSSSGNATSSATVFAGTTYYTVNSNGAPGGASTSNYGALNMQSNTWYDVAYTVAGLTFLDNMVSVFAPSVVVQGAF